MKYLISVLVGGATITVAITTALAQAHGAFNGHAPLMPYLYGYAVAAILLVIAVLMAVRVAKQEKSTLPPSPAPPPAIRDITQKVEANPQQIVNIGDEFLRQLRENAEPAQPPTQGRLPKPEPNIKFLGIRPVKVDFVNDVPLQLCSFNERADGKIRSVVACFRNEAIFGRTIKPIYLARAQLKLFDYTGAEIGHGLSRAAWLGHSGDLVDLIPGGDAQCVILLLQDGGRLTIPSKARKSSGYGDTVSDKFMELEYPPTAIEISLLDSGDQLVIPPVLSELTRTGDAISYLIKQSE